MHEEPVLQLQSSLYYYFHSLPVLQGGTVWGMRVEKSFSVAFVFQVFSTIQGKTKARDFCYFSSEALQ